MYNITIKLPAREDLVSTWCNIKGYKTQIQELDGAGSPITIDNPVTELEFFENLIKQELLNLYVLPLQNYIYTQSNTEANSKVQELTEVFKNALELDIEKN